MLLERLVEYSRRLERRGDLPPEMYGPTRIRWFIDLDADGRFLGFVETDPGDGAKRKRGKVFMAPHVQKTSGVRAKLLAENGEYVLGVARPNSRGDRVAQCHRAFVAEVRACYEATREPALAATLRFLESVRPGWPPLPDGFDPSDTLTVRVDGTLPIDLASVQRYWAAATGAVAPEAPSAEHRMQCIICGRLRPAVRRHPFKVKRVPGGQSSGMALVSANSPAFESYGLQESLTAPTCHECAERFTKAANALIEAPDSHVIIGSLVYVFWTREAEPFAFGRLISSPQPDEVKVLLRSVTRGNAAATGIDPMPFYAAAFSASGGRLVVRDWVDTTVPEVRRHLARWFTWQSLAGPDERYFGLFELSAATARVARDIAPNTPKVLLRSALTGAPLPMWLLYQAVKRNQAEREVTRNRAALIKMVLLSNRPDVGRESALAELDLQEQSPAYLCGRLLAVLESIQRAAVPGINQTLVDRYYGTASSAPASVFGPLLRSAQAHLGKLRKQRRGAYVALERRLEEVQAELRAFPKVLTLEQQGLFALGYYHQRAADRTRKTATDAPVPEPES